MDNTEKSDKIEFGTLTHLILGNFKAFKAVQRIPIRPITLIYGKNNSGKSSIIQALLYLNHARRTGELDPDTIVKEGKTVMSGGLNRAVFGREKGEYIQLGWEWSNPTSCVDLTHGRIMHNVSVKHDFDFTVEMELNGLNLLSENDFDEARFFPALRELAWLKIEPAEEEEDAGAVVLEVAEAASAGFERLDG